MTIIDSPVVETIRKNAVILIVDDVDVNLSFLAAALQHEGFNHVVKAKSGRQALELCLSSPPHIIITDIVMPEMDGIALCRELRKREATKYIPVIMQTGIEKRKVRTDAFDAGATDFIYKPVDPLELAARVSVHLENKWLLDELRSYRSYMTEELKQAQDMQHILLPDEKHLAQIMDSTKLNILYHYQAPLLIGGDFWGCRTLSSDKVSLFMVDVSGHGISSALNAFRIHTLMEEMREQYGMDPGNYLTHLNQHLCSVINKGQFSTIFYGVIHLCSQTLEYATAAFTPSLLLRGNDASVTLLEQKGFPLGVHPAAEYQTHSVAFAKGDSLLLYSDALIETPDITNNKMMSLDMLKEAMQMHVKRGEGLEAETFFKDLMKTFKEHYEPRLSDDFTVTLYSR